MITDFWFLFFMTEIKDINDNKPITIKNIGHIYLKKTAASFVLINLFIAGAINIDWNNIMPIIIPEIKKGKFFDIIEKLF